ncbi:Phosphoribosylaminoimidazole-succinocarboxamide synthase [Alkalibacterium sp. AK22]|uniref:phosphoribosylaminoimidazolesuccinocarboxamide synthase n=1 Tax=Alkalibacterium sp. AK22 TaxID=1229520 RepID=UPI0004486979|nr:phosphoribosylaminoimidazolesuccinocarboxamide synthase [Alkalibacterium sp. AK22]EXJ23971.1 Phosphoribosylaminoimidazole-succinocarboxamide synthase [Alkalibacterium sp. AK22]
MIKGQLLYEGKAKALYTTSDKDQLWVEYKDQATAGNGERKETIAGKGQLNNQITSTVFEYLLSEGIPSHFVKKLSDTEQVIKKVDMFSLEVVVRNVTAGSFSRRLGVEEGTQLDFPVVEFYLKEDELNDPFINEDHIKVLKLATDSEVSELKEKALEVNGALKKLFDSIGITLIDFKLEFGKDSEGAILLADEISPDTCRLWEKNTNNRLDKDVFRQQTGDIVPVYQEVLNRLTPSHAR